MQDMIVHAVTAFVHHLTSKETYISVIPQET